MQVDMKVSKKMAFFGACLCHSAITMLLTPNQLSIDPRILQTWLYLMKCMGQLVDNKKTFNHRKGHEHRKDWAYLHPKHFLEHYFPGSYLASMFK